MTELSAERYTVVPTPAQSEPYRDDDELFAILGWFASMCCGTSAELRRNTEAGSKSIATWHSEGRTSSQPQDLASLRGRYSTRAMPVAILDDDGDVICGHELKLSFVCDLTYRWTLIVKRGQEHPPFSYDDTMFADRLLPPISAAVCTFSRLIAERQISGRLRGVLHSIECGVILINTRGEVVFANRRAALILDANDGLVCTHGRLSASRFRDAALLQAAISYAFQRPVVISSDQGEFAAPLISIGRTHPVPLTVALLPISAPDEGHAELVVALYVMDPAIDISGVIGVTCKMYGLTQAETRLATQIVSGLSLNDAAAVIQVREQTARAYLRQIFSKLGICRQAELVRVLLGGAVRVHARLVSLGT